MSDTVNSVGNQVTVTPTIVPATPKRSGGGFGRVIGSILGGVANIAFPGAGSIIGGFVNRGNGLDTVGMEAMMNQQAQQTSYMIQMQNKVQTQSQEFSTVSNLLKARHDSEMAAINNFKS